MPIVDVVMEFLTSKKFITAVSSVIAAAAMRINLELPTEDIALLIAPLMAYIIGQGWADTGKSAERLRLRGH